MTIIKILSIIISFLLPISNIVAAIINHKTNKLSSLCEFLTFYMWAMGIMWTIGYGIISLIIK